MPLFNSDKYKALVLMIVLGLDSSTSLSSSNTRAPKLAKQRASPPQKQSKAWRYSRPKNSRWDIRHTKSFRFELQAPNKSANRRPTSYSSTTNTDESQLPLSVASVLNSHDVLPLHKKPRESLSHVLGKGILWALFKEKYGVPPTQTILVETPIPQEPRFVPDAVAFDVAAPTTTIEDNTAQSQQQHVSYSHLQDHQPTFWGESGRMSAEKAAALACKYPHTHFVHLRWGSQVSMDIFEDIENAVLPSLQHRTAPFEFALLNDKPQFFIAEDGTVALRKEDLLWRTARFDIDLDY